MKKSNSYIFIPFPENMPHLHSFKVNICSRGEGGESEGREGVGGGGLDKEGRAVWYVLTAHLLMNK